LLRKPNPDGLINCLRQPGQLRNQPQKSIRVNINPLIKSCGTRTDPAAETKSIELPADAQLSWFLQGYLDNFIVTGQYMPIYRDLKKLRHRTVIKTIFSLLLRMCNLDIFKLFEI
jgi:hypothetical protein